MFVRDRSWQICYIHSVYFPYVCRNGMARTIRNPKIDSRTARAKLPQRPEPYWTVISEGCALGNRRGSNSAARVRTRKGDTPRFRPHAVTPEASRRRGATANRVLTILKAALNEAYHEAVSYTHLTLPTNREV